MNFVLELSCEEFIRLHARCRGKKLTESDDASLCREVMECANSLAGERFSKDTVITQLSGGQSRALMIADIACISDSPVVLIDEPENAGIDRDDILKLLSDRGKIVLVSTHDPLIALSCSRRIIIKNGGIAEILDRTQQEKMLLNTLRERDRVLKAVRECIRSGRQVLKEDCYGI
jgi:ABC-type lipoprotein export system ATPase subunit